ncbi:mechanosensitive ion channel family protein [Rhodospirillum sp. A1_3_36]|uniref:mechanosensitive ion channel family protein n=1 Tax=Rhodospirillum sp. A1_3_36 TaxID=3391666 RepID=UPI0039A40F7A
MPVESIKAEIVTIQETTSSWIAQFNGTWLWVGLALLIIGSCLGAALLVHRAVWRSVAARLPRPSARAFTTRLRRPTRLAAALGGLILAFSVLPFDNDMRLIANRVLALGTIMMVGWSTIALIKAGAELSILRFRIDEEDNLQARKFQTQMRLFVRAGTLLIGLVTVGSMLLTIPQVREFGVGLFASAGVAGIVMGIAARPVLSNLIAGVQIALSQPIRIEDAVVVEGEWGWIEEITLTYVVIRIWDWRRLVVPLTHFVEKPYQNWTRESASIIGSVFWEVDPTAPFEAMRAKLSDLLAESPLWDGNVNVLQVTDSGAHTVQLRALMSAKNSPVAWDLRCEIREKMITWLQSDYPEALPRLRAQMVDTRPDHETPSPAQPAQPGDVVSAGDAGLRQSFKTEHLSNESPVGLDE